MIPIKIKVIDRKDLQIVWNNGKQDLLNLRQLRKLCPCATCLSERDKQSKRFIPLFSESQVTIKSINQVGNYAIQITWNDGHNSGIYEYYFLENFSEKTAV